MLENPKSVPGADVPTYVRPWPHQTAADRFLRANNVHTYPLPRRPPLPPPHKQEHLPKNVRGTRLRIRFHPLSPPPRNFSFFEQNNNNNTSRALFRAKNAVRAIHSVTRRRLSQGETLFRQGAIGRALYTVEEGELDVVKEHEGVSRTVARLSPGKKTGYRVGLSIGGERGGRWGGDDGQNQGPAYVFHSLFPHDHENFEAQFSTHRAALACHLARIV